jgi:hypothetical protein
MTELQKIIWKNQYNKAKVDMAILNLENFVAEYKLINNWVINKD